MDPNSNFSLKSNLGVKMETYLFEQVGRSIKYDALRCNVILVELIIYLILGVLNVGLKLL